MTFYVAGPMTGYPNENLPAFNAAKQLLDSLGYDVVVPSDVCGSDEHDHVRQNCLASDLVYVVKEAKGIIVLPGWHRSSGASAEVAAAVAMDKPVYEFGPFLLYGTEPPAALTGE